MSTRGRKASQPEQPHHRPVALAPGGLIVEHRDRKGDVSVYDFGTLTVNPAMQRSWAVLSAARCVPGGGWDSRLSSQQIFWIMSDFARFLAGQDKPPRDIDELTPAHWAAWRIKVPATSGGGYAKISRSSGFLRADPRLRADTRAAMTRRLSKVKPTEKAFTGEEFLEIRTEARRMFRSAYLRIEENTGLLRAWRLGQLALGTDEWRVGEVLDFLARTGDVPRVPRDNGQMRVPLEYSRLLGGEGPLQTWKRLYLGRMEAAALAVLLVAEFGLNATTAGEMPVPRATPDSGEGGTPTYRLELEKRRRGAGNHFETRNVTDLGADTAGRLISQALRATAAARAFVHAEGSELDRLLIWRYVHPKRRPGKDSVPRVGQFGVGLDTTATRDWGAQFDLGNSPMRRMRKTANVLHRREPGQNTQDTHDRVYVLNEPQVQQAAIPEIAQGATDALEAAHRTVLAQLAKTRREGDQETATADCSDFHNSPFTEQGQACDASFLLCLGCPNARVTPDHHPRLTVLHRALANLKGVLDPGVWAEDWDEPHARLTDLKTRLGTPIWHAAMNDVSPADRNLINDLLNGNYDK